MKKLITILTIMIVLVGAVFAADPAPVDAEGTATIDVKTSIGPQYPTFQLKVTESTSVTINTATSNVTNPAGANGKATIDTNELIENPVTISFAVDQISNSRCTVNYTINIKATDLVIDEPAGQQIAADEKFTVSAIQNLSASGTIATKRTVAVADQGDLKDGYSAGLAVSYLGGKYVNVTKQESPDPKQIGTFDFTWSKNEDAKVGNYSATVVVEVVVAD